MSLRDHRIVYESANPDAFAARQNQRDVAAFEESEAEADREALTVETGVVMRRASHGIGEVLATWLRSNPVDAKILAYRVTHGLEFSDIALLVGKSRRAVEERFRRMTEKCADPSLLS